jgi:hypothetical protein
MAGWPWRFFLFVGEPSQRFVNAQLSPIVYSPISIARRSWLQTIPDTNVD